MLKICKQCSIEKELSEFRKRKSGIFSPTCKKCYRDNWYSKNKDYQKNYDKKRWIENKDKEKIRNKNWRKSNYKKWFNEKMKNDELFNAKIKIRWCVKSSFSKYGYSKDSKTFDIIGLSLEDFKNYITDKFQPGMTWDNHGKWHLDHIIPLSSAKSKDELLLLNHYTNFQPLWAHDNLSKGDKYDVQH